MAKVRNGAASTTVKNYLRWNPEHRLGSKTYAGSKVMHIEAGLGLPSWQPGTQGRRQVRQARRKPAALHFWMLKTAMICDKKLFGLQINTNL